MQSKCSSSAKLAPFHSSEPLPFYLGSHSEAQIAAPGCPGCISSCPENITVTDNHDVSPLHHYHWTCNDKTDPGTCLECLDISVINLELANMNQNHLVHYPHILPLKCNFPAATTLLILNAPNLSTMTPPKQHHLVILPADDSPLFANVSQ